MRVVSVKEMKEIEQLVIEKYGFSQQLISENVGIKGASKIRSLFPDKDEAVFLVGPGNNGADGVAIARHLKLLGVGVKVFVLSATESKSNELNSQLKLATHFGVRVFDMSSADTIASYLDEVSSDYLLVDAILGVGFREPLSNYYFDIVNMINDLDEDVISIDMPTGINGETGFVKSNAVNADITLTVGFPKVGHYVGDGSFYSGRVITLDVGFPRDQYVTGDKFILSTNKVKDIYQERNKFAHKNRFGHSLVVGGSKGLTGALLMASESALKVGTGLVTASTWPDNYEELASRIIPQVMTGTIPIDDKKMDKAISRLDRYDTLVLGPGLGRSELVRQTVVTLLNSFSGPVVLDADGIRAVRYNQDKELLRSRKGETIITPHIGEFADFLEVSIEQVLEDPIGYLKKTVEELNICVVLKGPCTYIALTSGDILINYFPNDGMATGGSGDVLAGIIGGVLAQNIANKSEINSKFQRRSKIFQAVCLGAWAHTLAGKFAAKKEGARAMTAQSIINHLSDAFFEIENSEVQENLFERT